FGVSPSAFLALKRFPTGGKGIERRLSIDEKVAVLLVMNQRPGLGVVVCGVAESILIYPEIMMKEYTDLGFRLAIARNAHTPKKRILVTRDRIIANERDPEALVFEPY